MVENHVESKRENKRSSYLRIWIVSSIVVPILLDFIFLGTSAARYSRVIIFLVIAVSLLFNHQEFLKGNMIGFEIIVLTLTLFSIGTYSSVIRGGTATPNFLLLALLMLLISLNFDLYKIALNSIGLSCHILIFSSIIVMIFELNPRNFNFPSSGYPVFFDFIGIPGRNYGVFSHPNTLGQVSALSALFILDSGKKRVLMLAPLFCLLKCGSRTAIICLAVGTLIYAVALFFKNSKFSSKRNIESTLTVGLFLIFLFLASSVQFLNFIGFLDPGSLTGRASIWQTSLELFQESQLLGLGWGWQQRAIDSQLLNFWAVSSHNAILEVVFSSGLAGLGVFFAIVAKSVIYFMKLLTIERMLLASIAVSGVSEASVNLQYPTIQTLILLVITLGSNFERGKLN
jgi:O-antigen ligase